MLFDLLVCVAERGKVGAGSARALLSPRLSGCFLRQDDSQRAPLITAPNFMAKPSVEVEVEEGKTSCSGGRERTKPKHPLALQQLRRRRGGPLADQ